jgi:chromosome segregation protein
LALVGAEREVARASEEERTALRALDQAEAARERLSERLIELDAAKADLAEQRKQAAGELKSSEARRAALPDPESGRATLSAAQAKHEAARQALQGATAELAAHDQALAVARERKSARAADMKGWEARAGDATRRLSETALRLEQIAEERAVVAAKPAALMAEIEQGDAVRERLGR